MWPTGSTKTFTLSTYILRHTRRQILHVRSASHVLRPIPKNQYGLIRSIFLYDKKEESEEFKSQIEAEEDRTCSCCARHSIALRKRRRNTREISDAVVGKREINGNSLSEAESGRLAPLLEARPTFADVRLPGTASGERSASRRRPRGSGARRRLPVRYRRLADTEYRQPGSRSYGSRTRTERGCSPR